jgi:hypothetical protein
VRALTEYSDTDLENQFLEAERNALAWSELGIRTSDARATRWMEIAAELRAEIERRAANPLPRKPTVKKRKKR